MTRADPRPRSASGLAAAWLLLAAFAATIAYAVWAAAGSGSRGLSEPVLAALEETGVDSPVTGVLMGFRAYDTLLELVVLVVAYSGLRLRDMSLRLDVVPMSPVLDILQRLLVPFLTLFAAYLLWAGSHTHGGAFQAGAVLAAAGMLAGLSGGQPGFHSIDARAARAAIVVGPLVFAAAGLAAMPAGGALLEYSSSISKPVIIVVETAAAVSIAATLIALFAGRPLLGDVAAREAR